ncbi:hypothetical protein [Streptomyces sp. NPDC056144]|uniref:hypothetical protein n=1 Tax=unclassified Streptomyces TaxID=2593676 RepID=UPI0035E3A95D
MCPKASIGFNPCDLPVGTYRLDIGNYEGGYTGETRIAVLPLMSDTGCTGPVSTDIGAQPTTGALPDLLGILCHSFTAEQGDLVKAQLKRVGGYATFNGWITDGAGKYLCSVGYPCVLPAGTGGYRILSDISAGGSPGPITYTVQVPRFSDPVGCAVASVTPYGSGPADAVSPVPCRTFTPTSSGPYDIQSFDATGSHSPIEIYGPTGPACADYMCRLTAGVTYTLVSSDRLRIIDHRSSEGCTDVVFTQPQQYSIAERGEVDCLYLAAPQGSRVALMSSSSKYVGAEMDVTVRDATGALICWDFSGAKSCVLDGTAPYRALVAGKSTSFAGSYRLVVHRTDEPSTCRTFPAGDFGSNSTSVKATVEADAFFDCLTIPANAHASRELLDIADTDGYRSVDFAVIDEKGHQRCSAYDIDDADDNRAICSLTPGLSHMVLLRSSGTPIEHTLIRRDVTATARGCITTPATAAGRPSTAGVPLASGGYVCHRVTTADARDTLHLEARQTSAVSASTVGVYLSDGADTCDDPVFGCAVTGSTGYQVIVDVEPSTTSSAAYRVDALRIATASGPAPECVKIPNVSYGFGPLVATLSEQKSAICATLPTAAGDSFSMPRASGVTLSGTPTPRLYTLDDLQDGCLARYNYNRFECDVPEAEEVWRGDPRSTVLVIGMPYAPATPSVPLSATFTCVYGHCGTIWPTIGTVTPGTVGAGKITMKVTGTALHEKDVVELSYGSYRARSTTVSVAADRKSMVVALDLTSAPRRKLNTTVVTHSGDRESRGQITVIDPLHVTAAPKITGTVVTGGKVTATTGTWSPTAEGYTYQWRANGVVIAGATASTYTIPATLQGKSLSVSVTARKAGHPSRTAGSAYAVVKGIAPKPTKLPYFTGATRVGSKLTAVVGTWSPAPTSYAYQWRANGVAISGATWSTYTPVASVLGKKLTVTVTAHRTGHLSGAYTTAGYTVATGVAPKATAAPYVSGTVKVGRTLTVNRGTWTPAPTSYAYQWYANGVAVSGATKSTFVPATAQRGKKLTVKVTARRTGHYSGVAWTRATVAVVG